MTTSVRNSIERILIMHHVPDAYAVAEAITEELLPDTASGLEIELLQGNAIPRNRLERFVRDVLQLP